MEALPNLLLRIRGSFQVDYSSNQSLVFNETNPDCSTSLMAVRSQKKRLEEKLRSLVVPDAEVALDAGKILQGLPGL